MTVTTKPLNTVEEINKNKAFIHLKTLSGYFTELDEEDVERNPIGKLNPENSFYLHHPNTIDMEKARPAFRPQAILGYYAYKQLPQYNEEAERQLRFVLDYFNGVHKSSLISCSAVKRLLESINN